MSRGDADWQRTYAEAIAAGYDDDLAKLIADECDRGDAKASGSILKLCAMYGARDLALDMVRHSVPFAAAARLLENAVGSATTIGPGASMRLRSALNMGAR